MCNLKLYLMKQIFLFIVFVLLHMYIIIKCYLFFPVVLVFSVQCIQNACYIYTQCMHVYVCTCYSYADVKMCVYTLYSPVAADRPGQRVRATSFTNQPRSISAYMISTVCRHACSHWSAVLARTFTPIGFNVPNVTLHYITLCSIDVLLTS